MRSTPQPGGVLGGVVGLLTGVTKLTVASLEVDTVSLHSRRLVETLAANSPETRWSWLVGLSVCCHLPHGVLPHCGGEDVGELAGLASSASAFSEVTTDLAALQELHTFFGLHQASLDIILTFFFIGCSSSSSFSSPVEFSLALCLPSLTTERLFWCDN